MPRKVLGMDLYLDPDDSGLSVELAVEGIHEPIWTEMISSLIGEGMVMVDIGANLGYYAILESRLVGPQGRVIACEPSPAAFLLLQKNIEANRASNVCAHNVAVGDAAGSVTLYVFGHANQNALMNWQGMATSSVTVPMVSLDDLVRDQPRVDSVRMDIEGYECVVVRGMQHTLATHRPLLFVELHSGLVSPDEVRDFLKTLQDAHYEVKWQVMRMKDEVFLGRTLGSHKRAIERSTIEQLMHDDRLYRLRENVSVVFAPKR